MNWWWLVAAFLAPWLRFVVQPSMSIRAAAIWGISVLGTGLIGEIVALGVARLVSDEPPEWALPAFAVSAAVMVSGVIILGIATVQANAADRRRAP